MTAPENVATPDGRGDFLIRPRTETTLSGTPFAVWHDGYADATVRVLPDGALDLTGPTYWIVGLTDTWQGAEVTE